MSLKAKRHQSKKRKGNLTGNTRLISEAVVLAEKLLKTEGIEEVKPIQITKRKKDRALFPDQIGDTPVQITSRDERFLTIEVIHPTATSVIRVKTNDSKAVEDVILEHNQARKTA